jgi:hypothetical protein
MVGKTFPDQQRKHFPTNKENISRPTRKTFPDRQGRHFQTDKGSFSRIYPVSNRNNRV